MENKQIENNEDKIFQVDGFGQVGYANLWAFIPLDGQKQPGDLKVNESTVGYSTGSAEGRKNTDKLTRVK